jgi:hypothetical protein
MGKLFAAVLGLPAIMLTIAPAGGGSLVGAPTNNASAGVCTGLDFNNTNNLCAPVVTTRPPPGLPTDPVNLFAGALPNPNDPSTNNSFVHAYGNPIVSANISTVQFSTEFGSSSVGQNSFIADGTYEMQATITGFTNPMMQIHFQPGQVTVSESNSGDQFEAARLSIRIGVGPASFLERAILLDISENLGPRILEDGLIPLLNAVKVGCNPGDTRCSYVFDAVTTPIDLSVLDPTLDPTANTLIDFKMMTVAEGNVVFAQATTGGAPGRQGMSVARSGDPSGPFTEFGFTIFEGAPVPMPEPGSLLLVVVGLAGLAFPLFLKWNGRVWRMEGDAERGFCTGLRPPC